MSSPRYPVPPSKPEYRPRPSKVSARGGMNLFELVSALFVGAALLLSFWLAALLLVGGLRGHWRAFAYLFFFWAVAAYLALPRVHQLFTLFYVPDYFIGRSRTADGVLGDPVNLCVDGTEADIHGVMQAAGWSRSHEYSVRSVYRMIVSSLLRRSYPEAPISALFLFGRRQDFAYQQEVDGNPSQRHHVRFWRVPEGWLLPGGQNAEWLAAATYDRAVGLSAFTGQITHKIDEDIDIERDYVIDTVRFADPGSTVHVIQGFSTAYHHRNGGGDRVRTDGDMPILDVTDAAERVDERFLAAEQEDPNPITRHHVPPVTLVTAGALWALRLVVALVSLLLAVQPLSNLLHDLGSDSLLLDVGLALAGVVLWWLTVARHRWAWVVLMLAATFDAVQQLSAINSAAIGDFWTLLGAALAVCTVLAASATPVRDWVSKGRRERTVEIPERLQRPARLSRR